MTKAEQETIIRWDQDERLVRLWTAYAPDARLWERAGFNVNEDTNGRSGQDTTWSADVPVGAIRYRPVRDGQIVRRKGHRKGRLLGVRADELIGAAS
jgi:hypothetical protein